MGKDQARGHPHRPTNPTGSIMLTTKEKRKVLEAAGWKFLRRDSRKKWVRVNNSNTVARCIEYSYAQHIKEQQ